MSTETGQPQAREVFQALSGHCAVPDFSDLRPRRRAKNLTLTAAAKHLGAWPARIGVLELGRRPNEDLATRYRAWLNAAWHPIGASVPVTRPSSDPAGLWLVGLAPCRWGRRAPAGAILIYARCTGEANEMNRIGNR